MPKGNKSARGTLGNKGGGREALPPDEKKTKQLRMTQRLFDKINKAAMKACYDDWRKYVEALIDMEQTSTEQRP